MKRVLVTGASGFIGRNCLPLLINLGYEVHAVSNQNAISSETVTWHQADLLDSRVVEALVKSVEPSHVLHLAWCADPGKFWTSPDNLAWVQASMALLSALSLTENTRVVMAGTCAEYDWRYGWCSEDVTPLIPTTLYGTCKNSLQSILSKYSQQHGLSSAWGRVFFLYGEHEHQSRLVSSVINALLLNQTALCSHGEQIRDFLHVRDVAAAFVALLESNVQGAFNIASGNPVAIKQVVREIARKMDCPNLLNLGALSTSEQDPPLLLADVHKLRNELGWQPSVSLSEGLDATISWWKNHRINS